MATWTLIFAPIVAWFVLVLISRLAHQRGLVDHNPVLDFPFQDENEKGKVPQNLAVHLLMSIFFAVLYAMVWGSTGAYANDKFLVIALFTGLLHGGAVALGMSILNAQKRDGFQQSMLILFAHVVFALVAGLAVSNAKPQMESLEAWAESLSNPSTTQDSLAGPTTPLDERK